MSDFEAPDGYLLQLPYLNSQGNRVCVSIDRVDAKRLVNGAKSHRLQPVAGIGPLVLPIIEPLALGEKE